MDAISKFTRATGNVNATNDKSGAKSAPPNTESSKGTSETDKVVLSEAVATALRTNDFDNSKVDKIKQQIAEGKYPLDSKVIAENFVALESMID